MCSLKGQSIWVPKFYSCCYTKTRNGSHVASVPTHWTELNLHAQQSVSDYDEWIGSIPFWSALLAVWKFRFCFARACPRKNSTQDEYEIRQRGAFTATSSPQLMNLIGRTRKNTRHALKTIELHVWHVPKTIVLHVRYALNTLVLHVRHALLNNSLQINDVKLPHFRFRWQLKKTTINLYFLYLFQGRALTAPQLKRISPTLNNLNKMK